MGREVFQTFRRTHRKDPLYPPLEKVARYGHLASHHHDTGPSRDDIPKLKSPWDMLADIGSIQALLYVPSLMGPLGIAPVSSSR